MNLAIAGEKHRAQQISYGIIARSPIIGMYVEVSVVVHVCGCVVVGMYVEVSVVVHVCGCVVVGM